MYTLAQSVNIMGRAGTPIPTVFKTLERHGCVFRQGQLCLIAAAPGAGKSAFALNLVLKSRATAYYFSADSDSYTQVSRALSIVKQQPMSESEKQVRNHNLDYDVISSDMLRVNYSSAPTLDEIQESLAAYYEVYAEYPEIVVIDNVTNVGGGGDDPFEGLESLMDYLHGLARKTQSCVLGLHHVTGEYNSPRFNPKSGNTYNHIPLNGVKGQIARVPEMVLTLFDNEGSLGVSVVKNRGGKADPSGWNHVNLDFDKETMSIGDW